MVRKDADAVVPGLDGASVSGSRSRRQCCFSRRTGWPLSFSDKMNEWLVHPVYTVCRSVGKTE